MMIELPTPPGAPEVKGKMDPMIPGPYVYVRQFEVDQFLKSYLTTEHVIESGFELRYGYATFACDIHSGQPILVGYYFDTSG